MADPMITDSMLTDTVKDAAKINEVETLLRVIEEDLALSTVAIGQARCWRVISELKERRWSMFRDLTFKLSGGVSGYVEKKPSPATLEWTGIQDLQLFWDCEWMPEFSVDENRKDMIIPTIGGGYRRIYPGNWLVKLHGGRIRIFVNPSFTMVLESSGPADG